ncbi:hypothetical protein B0J13DRAFT_461938 [Dactylonectria estremocensis]|uniref:Uncharacterized protein n=1 Tax=Dactylonectria estremocensis TaxID=1079267 RepID=A0A9P9D2E0_9HYPO|nr:hypothetical protein B0J13DRAFT_461938 [Dactylonectria estremocensis]
MTALARSDGHVSLRPNCGIFLGNGNSTAFSQRLGPYIFPGYGHRIRGKDGILLCRKPACSLCAVSPEASTVHSDCYEFVAQRSNVDRSLDYLWVVTAWRTPWRRAPKFRLEEAVVKSDWSVFDHVNTSRMRSLPPEILKMIYEYSATSIIWRFNAASEVIQRLTIPSSDHLLSIPLREVSAWKRSGQPWTTETAHNLPVVRLTIDSRGIQEVERLPGNPLFRRWRTDGLVFVTLNHELLDGVIAHFKFGSLRLELPKTCHGIQTWDTPTPPDLQKCRFYPNNILHSTQFKTIDLCQTNGITLFFCNGQVYAIHAHTQKAPCALATYQRLSPRRQRSVAWVYVPFSQRDYITALGARMSLSKSSSFGSTCLLVSGDVSVGLTSARQAKDLLLSKSRSMTMIYDTLELQPVSVIGAYPTGEEDHSPMTPFRHPFIDDAPFSNACFSFASLDLVDCMRVFNDKLTGLCLGILLHYQNGAQRSLGQCRVDVDPVEDYVKPVHLCFRRQVHVRPGTPVQLQATMVRGTSSQEHNHDEQGWTCFEMQGALEFWFSCEETRLTAIVH